METNTPNISEKDRSSILNHVIKCANCALQSEDAFQKAMLGLAGELRRVFDSEYCSIGIVTDGYAEDCVISYKKFEDEELSKQQEESLKSVKRVDIEDDSNTVSLALKSNNIAWFKEEKMDEYGNYSRYKTDILPSREVKNSCVIPLRDSANRNYGFIQLINTKKTIDYNRDLLPFKDAFLGLVQTIINIQKTKLELANRLKDANFYNLMQEKRNNVDELLDSIMEYFSKEFNAAIVSFRIPVLNGYNKVPLFYLRRVFVHPSIEKRSELMNRYFTDRLVKNKAEMSAAKDLRCDYKGKILESKPDSYFTKNGLNLDNNTFIMPIFQNLDIKCIHPQRPHQTYCNEEEHHECNERFKRYYGFFRLRISKTDLNNSNDNYFLDFEEIKERLLYLSKQITLLIDSIVNKNENESLQIFQNELKNSSFVKIKDFDERCVEIIRQSSHSKVCSIYRYDERKKVLSMSATTADIIQFTVNGQKLFLKTSQVKDKSCFISTKDKNNIISQVFNKQQTSKVKPEKDKQRSVYVFDIMESQIHQSPFIEFIKNTNEKISAMAIPMIKKDGSCAGVVLLLGKEGYYHPLSTSYWEHDIRPIEFIVNILTRISESDTERLTFFSQLSHELLTPVTELVYDNELTAKIAERNPENFSRQQLISKLRENIDRYMLFKFIINDAEFIYSSSNKEIGYKIVKQEKPQEILLNAIRLLENKAHVKGLSIRTSISNMPPLYFDKERMMQVFINLLKNAIRYSDKYTTIEIFYKKENDLFHEIRFSNVGIGIQKDEKETIFDLFHRGKEAKKKIIQGTGMGLYIVRDIMRAHGGDCYVRKLKDPTEFVITLPNK